MIGQPAHSEDDEDHDEHLGHLPHLLLCSPVIVLVADDGGLPLESPECSAEVSVGDGQAQEWEDVGHEEEHHLVDVVHEGGVGGTIRPDQETGGGSVILSFIIMICLGGGEEEGGARHQGADGPDAEDGQGESE